MEFIMETNLATALPQVIDFNHEALKAELEERLRHYNGLVVTDDAIPEAKADRAKLNKLREALETKRKEVKKQCLVPYNDFEAKVKELVALVDQPILAIDGQLKAYDEMRREEKRQQIAEAYASIVPDHLKDIIPLQIIFSPKWENATTSIKKVEEELDARVKRTNADMLVLDTIEAEYAGAVREVYIRTLDIEKAVAHKAALVAAAEAFQQREATTPAPQEEKAVQPTVEQTATPKIETVYLLRLEMQLTMDQANALKRFLADNNINYKKI